VQLNKKYSIIKLSQRYKIIELISKHLDIYQIHIDGVTDTFDYVWSDDNYKQMQINFLKPGYDWSLKNV
jgi:hypothetical protein